MHPLSRVGFIIGHQNGRCSATWQDGLVGSQFDFEDGRLVDFGCDPAGVENSIHDTRTGGVAPLNHRLMAATPAGVEAGNAGV
jgi:hypothetical protein